MTPKRKSFMLYPKAEVFVEARSEDNFSTALNRTVERYAEILVRARAKLLSLLSEKEMALIIDVLNGALFAEPISIHMVHAEIDDAILMEGMAEKWKVDGKALVEKLRTLEYVEKVALVDAAERFWNSVANGNQPGWLDTLRRD